MPGELPVVIASGSVLRRPTPGGLAEYLGLTITSLPERCFDLVVVGAGHVAVPIAQVGRLLGFEVIVVDDRPSFATAERFPDADRIIVMERGQIAEQGSHVELLRNPGGIYNHLYQLQLGAQENPPQVSQLAAASHRGGVA